MSQVIDGRLPRIDDLRRVTAPATSSAPPPPPVAPAVREPALPPKFVVIVAAIAAAAPLTAAIHGGFTAWQQAEAAEAEHALRVQTAADEQTSAKAEYDFKTRTAFLDRAIDPKNSPADREKVLRFLVAVISDEKMQAWAQTELTTVTNELDALKQQLKQAEEKLERAKKEAADALKAAETAHATEKARLQKAAALAVAKAEQAERDRKRAELKAGGSRDYFDGARAVTIDGSPLTLDGSPVTLGRATVNDCVADTIRTQPETKGGLSLGGALAIGICSNKPREYARAADTLTWKAHEGTDCFCRVQ